MLRASARVAGCHDQLSESRSTEGLALRNLRVYAFSMLTGFSMDACMMIPVWLVWEAESYESVVGV